MTSDNLTPNDSTTGTMSNDRADSFTRSEVKRLEQQVQELQNEIDNYQS